MMRLEKNNLILAVFLKILVRFFLRTLFHVFFSLSSFSIMVFRFQDYCYTGRTNTMEAIAMPEAIAMRLTHSCCHFFRHDAHNACIQSDCKRAVRQSRIPQTNEAYSLASEKSYLIGYDLYLIRYEIVEIFDGS